MAFLHFRLKQDTAIPDLSGADLSKADLRRAHLSGADLSKADLRRAHLSGADLRRTDLRRADLRRAHLRRAHLRRAHLRRAHLRRAHLSGADLRRAHLRRAHLNRADLVYANLGGADLRMAQLIWAYLIVTDLRKAQLSEADLGLAHLGSANLGEADLHGADLYGADLHDADLSKADLSNSNLNKAHLRMADLRGANLSNAQLRWADLRKVQLSGAQLSNAVCDDTTFTDVDLSKVKGLDSVIHYGPSMVGIDTLFRSRGNIPEAFLQGCGVPESVIVNRFALIGAMEPIQFYSCFISYSSKDEEFAKRLHSRMRDQGLRVWFAPEDVQGGKKLHEQIDEAIRVYDKLLLVLSPRSMKSEWVKTEIRKARRAELKEKRRKLFPIRLVGFKAIQEWECFDADSGKDLGVEIREYFIPDFSKWKVHDPFEEAFARLLKDLKAEESVGSATPPGTLR